jgi:acetylornithine deacetylase/succinyl-diaminopimelate desuccinylase-like protein
VDAYLQARGKLPVRVKFIIEGEEEIGSPHLREFVAQNQALVKADACIWETGYIDPQGRPALYLGAKGMLYVELTAHKTNIDLHSAWGAIVPNPAWYLLQALQSLRDAEGRVLIPGFYDRVRSPTGSDLAALQRMSFDAESYQKQLGLTSFINDLSGVPLLEQYLFQPTCTICGLWSGYTGEGLKTVLPYEAKAKLDFRLVPDQDAEEIFELLQEHLVQIGFGDIQVDFLTAEQPARTPTDHPFARLVTETGSQVYGQEALVYPMMPGTGPMHVLCQQFDIPTVSIGVGNTNSHNHAPNENIRLADFYQGIAYVAAILDRFGDGYL